MDMSIPEEFDTDKNFPDAYIQTRKTNLFQHRIPRDILLVGVLIFSSSLSFGLGMLAGKETGNGNSDDKLWIESLPVEVLGAAVGTAPATSVTGKASETKVQAIENKPTVTSANGQFVASKSGTKYYLPWCGSVKRIKEENKVWFTSKSEAEGAGYMPAKNCKGL